MTPVTRDDLKKWPEADPDKVMTPFLKLFSTEALIRHPHYGGVDSIKTGAIATIYNKMRMQLLSLNTERNKLSHERAAALRRIESLKSELFSARKTIDTLAVRASGGVEEFEQLQVLGRMQPGAYRGEQELDHIEGWLRGVERYIAVGGGVGEALRDRRINAAWKHLEGEAWDWFEESFMVRYSFKRLRGGAYPASWGEFRKDLVARFADKKEVKRKYRRDYPL